MKKIGNLVAMILTGVMILLFVGCNIVERTEESKQKVVLAKVGKTKITKADVDKAIKTYLDYYKEQCGDDFESDETLRSALKSLRTQQLQGLVDKEVLLQSKDKVGVNPTDEEVQTEVDKRIDYYKESLGTEESYESFIESYGYNDESFKEYLKQQVVLGMIVDSIISDVEVTDENIEEYYNENIDKYTTKAGADVTHILVRIEKDDDGNVVENGEEVAKEKAELIRKKALSGESLSHIANSDEFKNVCTYEELGRVNFEDSGMDQEFEDAFKKLSVGEVSEVVETNYGYHVIVNTAVYPQNIVKSLDDALKQEIKGIVLYNKQEDIYKEKLEQFKKNLNVKIYENRL
ncbi:MAG: hypothetical protein E7213_10065 [Clostridium sp.]|nr:hypothetical protein [Clostridium sp.]